MITLHVLHVIALVADVYTALSCGGWLRAYIFTAYHYVIESDASYVETLMVEEI